MSRYSDAPEDEAISLFAGLLANPDMTLSRCLGKPEMKKDKGKHTARQEKKTHTTPRFKCTDASLLEV